MNDEYTLNFSREQILYILDCMSCAEYERKVFDNDVEWQLNCLLTCMHKKKMAENLIEKIENKGDKL